MSASPQTSNLIAFSVVDVLRITAAILASVAFRWNRRGEKLIATRKNPQQVAGFQRARRDSNS
ncbi:MAG: hypothetical protein F2563_01170 [Actinobacteria bacterium]|nr:hypothetical protein [Actinomycetota bacterium]